MIETRQLRYFQAVAEELHFGRAAARLYIAQPALSRQIQQLEAEVGTKLFNRTQRRVELTPAGTLFLARTNGILEDVIRASMDVRRLGSGESGHLTVGFIHSSTYGLLPSIIERFRHLYPDVELELREMSINAQIVALSQGSIDIGLLRPQPAPPEIEIQAIMDDHFLLAVPHKHPLSGHAGTYLRAVDRESMIMFAKNESPMFHARITAMLDATAVTPFVVQKATQIHTIVGLVGAGLGIAIVPGIARNLRPKNVRFLEILDKPKPVQVGLAWQKGKQTPAARSFHHVTLLVLQQLSQQR